MSIARLGMHTAPAEPPYDVGVGERDAAGDERVHSGRDDLPVAQRVDGVEALVVGEKEQNVWALAAGSAG